MQTQSVSQLVKQAKQNNDDYEWYPSTPEQLEIIRLDMLKQLKKDDIYKDQVTCSILDVGAGNGSALQHLTTGTKFAIEKSQTMLKAMDKDIVIVGTDFYESTLMDKQVGAVFSNPPYSDFSRFTARIIREAYTKVAYFIIPQRWKSCEEILDAIEIRNGKATVIAESSFFDAQRQARGIVNIVRVDFSKFSREFGPSMEVDPFDVWFNDNFKINATKKNDYDLTIKSKKLKTEQSKELIKNKGLINALVETYDREMSNLMQNYLKVAELDKKILDELNVSVNGIKAALKLKIESLKNMYWRELFNGLNVITNKLTYESREKLLEKITNNSIVDFTFNNCHAIVLWCLKNSNEYINDQLCDTMKKMVEQANIVNYKSNEKMLGDEDWSYNYIKYNVTHYKLEHRIVVTSTGGLESNGQLSPKCDIFLNDLVTVAGNLGLDIENTEKADSFISWCGCKNAFTFRNHATGKVETLFEAKVFMNGNTHLKFHPMLILRLNVEHGRLKGWCKSAKQAAHELNEPEHEVAAIYGTNTQLGANSIKLLVAA